MKFGSKSPRKQRKFARNLPLHLRKNLCNCHLSKELHKELGKRAIGARTGDKAKVMRGKQKGKDGKITGVNYKRGFVFIDKIVRKKSDGKEVPVPVRASNVMLLELETSDERRLGKAKGKKATIEKKATDATPKAEKEKDDIWSEEKTEKKKDESKKVK